MTYSFESTRIWGETLASRGEDVALAARERLRNVFLGFRDRVALLAAEIHRELPDYTVHDITHLDALWEMADIIAGEDYDLTPTEAFVLGGTFLLHDLGMGLASYPEGLDDLRREKGWSDIVTAEFQKRFDRLPTASEILEPPNSIKTEAVAFMLRNLHARQAEHLAQMSWQAGAGDQPQFLIDDTEIRQVYGRVIGLIAHSHWWPINRVESEFSRTLGSPHWCPTEWKVDPLKIASLLRVSDASHIDARRAPRFLRAVRKPSAYSDVHWKFQEKLQKPYRVEDALAYTSGYAFPLEDAHAWWLCLDTLKMIDRELRQVDALLADKGLQRLAARRVAGIESPERLVSFIPVDGWLPVNAVVQVTDVPRLVKSLGGEELYGANPTIPLRELIQNSADAIRARRIVENRADDWGDIIVRLGKDAQGPWLEVEDNGVGMSSDVLINHLLDFGVTYWGSNLMMEEFPGLLAAGLKTTGKYGIGFFSVFMLGEAVRITTRRADAAQDETLVFEFNTGLSARPIIRPASKEERIRDGGTCIRVWLEKPPDQNVLLHHGAGALTLEEVCKRLCPSIDVTVITDQEGIVRWAVNARDWIELDGPDLLGRLPRHDELKDYSGAEYKDFATRASANLRILRNDHGVPVGRACVTKEYGWRDGVVTVGGLSACKLNGIAGVLSGESVRAARDIALPLVPREALSVWASEQATLIPKLYEQDKDKNACARIVRVCGGSTGDLPIGRYRNKWVSSNEISAATDLPDELMLLDSYQISGVEDLKGFKLLQNVIIIESTGSTILQSNSFSFYFSPFHSWPNHVGVYTTEDYFHRQWFMQQLSGAIAEAAAKTWLTTIEEVLAVSDIQEHHRLLVGYVEENELLKTVTIIRNPHAIAKVK